MVLTGSACTAAGTPLRRTLHPALSGSGDPVRTRGATMDGIYFHSIWFFIIIICVTKHRMFRDLELREVVGKLIPDPVGHPGLAHLSEMATNKSSVLLFPLEFLLLSPLVPLALPFPRHLALLPEGGPPEAGEGGTEGGGGGHLGV